MKRSTATAGAIMLAAGAVTFAFLPSESWTQSAGSFVALQASSPGTAQAGNTNVSGTVVAGENVIAGLGVSAGTGVVAYPDANGVAVNAFGTSQGIFASEGAGSGWTTPGFPYGAGIAAEGDNYGIVGKTATTYSSSGVVGNHFDGNSVSWFIDAGVSGIAYGTGYRGVAGLANQNIWGVLGTDTWGVTGQRYFDSTHSNYGYLAGPNDAVYGESQSASGNGVQGVANNGTAAYGVWGRSSSGYAGVFSGTTSVSGNFYATAKFFRIDHPQDPEHKYLIHSCIESDEQMNIYRGSATLDKRGEAWVNLPGYFSALNKEPGYQLTCVGGYAPVYVSSESENRFRISGGKPGIRVCWTVYGTRNDPYVQAHPMVVEKRKEGEEDGRLLTPKEYGYPEQYGMTYEKEQQAAGIEHPTSPGLMTRGAVKPK